MSAQFWKETKKVMNQNRDICLYVSSVCCRLLTPLSIGPSVCMSVRMLVCMSVCWSLICLTFYQAIQLMQFMSTVLMIIDVTFHMCIWFIHTPDCPSIIHVNESLVVLFWFSFSESIVIHPPAITMFSNRWNASHSYRTKEQ